jgi:hypothetical protein
MAVPHLWPWMTYDCLMATGCFGWARPQVSAVMRPTKEYPFMFSFFSEDGKDFQLYVDSQVSASDYPP